MHRRWYEIEGASLLRDACIGDTHERLAHRLGVSIGCLYFWRIGYKRPNAFHQKLLSRMLGIPIDSWDRVMAERQCTKGAA